MAIFLLSLLLGVAAVLSPTVLFAGMLPIALALLTERGRRRRILATATCAFLAVVLFLAPWVCRNYAVLDAFIPLRSNFGLELHIGNNDHSNGRTHSHGRMDPRSAINQLHPYNNKQQLEHLKRVGEVQYMHEKGHLAKQWIVDHPCQFLSLCATRLRLFWLPPPDLWDQKSQWNGFKSCVFSGIALLTLIVFVQFFVHRYPYRWILVAILVGYSAIYMVTHVDPRYRYPIFALTTLLAVHAIATIAKNVRIVASKYVRAVS